MSDLRTPAVLTPATIEQVFSAFAWAARTLMDMPDNKPLVLVLMAQSALETGRWKSMYNHNLGNVKAKVDGSTPYYMIPTTEILDVKLTEAYLATAGKREDGTGLPNVERLRPSGGGYLLKFYPPHPACAFRAFPTLDDGVADHFDFLTQSRYAKAVERAAAGDPAGYVDAIKAQRYFTGELTEYRPAVVSLYKEFSNKLRDVPLPKAPEPPLVITPFSLQDVTQSIINEDFRRHGSEED